MLLLALLLGTGLNVSPVQIWLSPDASKALLTLRNDGDSEARFQMTVDTWDEDAQTGMKLAPTDAIVFFPALLVLKPGESKNVRVGAAVPFGPVEKTFRIFVEELPPPQKPQSRSEVRVLTRVGVPIFLAPVKTLEDRKLGSVALGKGTAAIEVENTGNVHFRVDSVKLEGLAEGGAKLFERALQGWYLLAGGHKRYQLEVPASDCARIRRLLFTVKTEKDEIFQQPLDTPQGACGS
jgi:fimbrial chaperone protein